MVSAELLDWRKMTTLYLVMFGISFVVCMVLIPVIIGPYEMPRDEHGKIPRRVRIWLVLVSLFYSFFWMGFVLLVVPLMDLSRFRKQFRATYMQKTA